MSQTLDPSTSPLDSKVAEAFRLSFLKDQRRDATATVVNRVFGKDALKPIIEELNEVLVA